MSEVAGTHEIQTEPNFREDLETRIAQHWEEQLAHPSFSLWELSHAFNRDGYLKISHLIPEEVKAFMSEEAYKLLAKRAQRCNLVIPTIGNASRCLLSIVSQEDIIEHGKVIASVYHSKAFINFLETIADDEIIPNPSGYGKFIINRLEQQGDTHGWHWGDYPYSVIWIIEAPPVDYGGLLQCIPHTYWDKQVPRVQEYILRNPIRSYYHATGEVYLLKSDTTLHQVTPLEKEATRIVVAMAWERERDKDRDITYKRYASRDS